MFQVGTQQRSETQPRVPAGRRPWSATGRHRQDQARSTVRDRRRPDGRPVPEAEAARRAELGHVARPGARWSTTSSRAALPLRVPLVVRILRRQDDRLGRPPRRHRPVGHRHGQLRPDHRSKVVTAEHPGRLQGRLPDRRRPLQHRRPSSTSRAMFANGVEMDIRERHGENGITFEGDEGHDLRQPRAID